MKHPLADPALEGRWLVWREEIRRDGRKTKVPYDAQTGQLGSSTDPRTWTTRKCAEAFKHADGIGVALGDLGDGRCLIGIDLDSSRNRKTARIKGWARDIVDLVDSYTEISPSETGYKIFATMDCAHGLRGGAFVEAGHAEEKHPPAIEVYFGGRYFTVTNDEIGESPLRHVSVATMREVLDIAQEFAGKNKRLKVISKPADNGLASIVRMTPGPWTDEQVQMILDHLETGAWCEPRDDGWLKVGQALHHQYQGAADGLEATYFGPMVRSGASIAMLFRPWRRRYSSRSSSEQLAVRILTDTLGGRGVSVRRRRHHKLRRDLRRRAGHIRLDIDRRAFPGFGNDERQRGPASSEFKQCLLAGRYSPTNLG